MNYELWGCNPEKERSRNGIVSFLHFRNRKYSTYSEAWSNSGTISLLFVLLFLPNLTFTCHRFFPSHILFSLKQSIIKRFFVVVTIIGTFWSSRNTGDSRTKRRFGKEPGQEICTSWCSMTVVTEHSLINVIPYFFRELLEIQDNRDDQECKYVKGTGC